MLIEQLSAIDESLEPISLDIGSDELSMMRDMVDAGDYKGIYDLALSLSEKSIFDVRILIYGLYFETVDDKLATLSNLYQSLNVLLDSAWHAVGPEGKRDKYAKTSLAWLFKQILIDLQTQEIEAGAVWQGWMGTYLAEDIQALIQDSESTRHALTTALAEDAGGTLEKITELNNWFKSFIKLLPIPSQSDADAFQEAEPVSEVSSQPSSMGNTLGGVAATGSVHLDLLVEKMKVFERVIERGDLLKAAIVVADINAALEAFDPKVYFPDIFSQFYLVLVQHINEITEVMDMQDSPQWTVLNHLYQVDKNRFIDVEV